MFKKRFLVLRLLQFLTILVLCGIITYYFISLKSDSNDIRYQQTQKFAYSLTNLAAAEATRYLSQEKKENLQLLIDDLSNDPIVRDATVYDQLGQIIYQSNNVLPLPVLLNIGNNKRKKETIGVIPYIAELYVDQTKIGYLRITLEQKRILSLIQDYQDRGFSILIFMILLSFAAGIIFMAMFYRRTKAFYKNFIQEMPKLIEDAKNEANKYIK